MRLTPRYVYCGMVSSYAMLHIMSAGQSRICQSFVPVVTGAQPWKPRCWKLKASSQVVGTSDQAMPRRDVFDLLPKNAGVEKKFSLGVVSGGLRGLVADCDVEQGQ
ncbi:unnamed protein product, partial [Ascophyllum nodosum]